MYLLHIPVVVDGSTAPQGIHYTLEHVVEVALRLSELCVEDDAKRIGVRVLGFPFRDEFIHCQYIIKPFLCFLGVVR